MDVNLMRSLRITGHSLQEIGDMHSPRITREAVRQKLVEAFPCDAQLSNHAKIAQARNALKRDRLLAELKKLPSDLTPEEKAQRIGFSTVGNLRQKMKALGISLSKLGFEAKKRKKLINPKEKRPRGRPRKVRPETQG